MRVSDMNWMQVENYLKGDDRCALPLGCTEQHAYLSLSTDSILAERIALEAAEPLKVPVFPVVSYGLTPYFRAYPGTVTVGMDTYIRLVRDILDSLNESGFRRIVIVNGHGGNSPVMGLVREWGADNPGVKVKFHNWWNAPKTWAKVQAIDPDSSHASWMENFPWTRLAGVQQPQEKKPMADSTRLGMLSPAEVREVLGEGNFGGYFERPDADVLALWQVAVEETRALFTEGW